jgi:LAO/AO transport system kinase
LPELWSEIEAAHGALGAALDELRARQSVAWMWSEVTETLLDRLRADPQVRGELVDLEGRVAAGTLPPATAAHRVLHEFLDQR